MQTKSLKLTTALISVLSLLGCDASSHITKGETTYERVMRTHEIRCSYFAYEPALAIDANTKKKSGIFYDITQEMARRLGLKVTWTEEVGYGQIIEGFETNRYDMFCNVVWPTPERAQRASFTIPLYYSVVGVFVRADDNRFDADYSKLNASGVTLSVKDGDITSSVAHSIFPDAKFSSVSQMAFTEQQLEDVGMGKADATFNEPVLLYRYNKTAKHKLKDIAQGKPIKYFPSTYMFKQGEFQFKQMLDVTLGDMLSDGFIDRTIAKYEPYPNAYYRVGYPFKAQK